MRTVADLFRLTRPDTTLLIFLSVFLPTAIRTADLFSSLEIALPVLFIAMCTFILNDIDDVESDKTNHPDRPLPSGRVLLRIATGVYFACLSLALFTTKLLVPRKSSFLYYLLLILVINYKYAAEQFPSLKPVYVACVSSFPVLIVVAVLKGAASFYWIATATFFFVLGRELLLDYMDREGDPSSTLGKISRPHITGMAFTSQVAALCCLSLLAQTGIDVIALGVFGALSLIAVFLWQKSSCPKWATTVMKLQMYGGLYFLLR